MGEKPEHSPLGASSMSRWEHCIGSYRLIEQLAKSEFPEEEPEYRAEGTAAHELIELCLRSGEEPWMWLGQKMPNGVTVTVPMVTGVQTYLDEVLPIMARAEHSYIEFPISAPIHPLFYGKLDFGGIDGHTLYVRDYKNGEGLAVNERGPQTKYYAYGVLHLHPEIRRVNIGIVQPNFIGLPPVRSYEVDAEEIHMWALDELLPAMHAAERGGPLVPGEWCIFCPAKLVCPALSGMFAAACNASPNAERAMSDAQLALNWKMIGPVKKFIKALEEETFRRMNGGRELSGLKLTYKKTNRVWKTGADVQFDYLYGDSAYTERELKSPAQMEDIGANAAELVKQWAFTPEAGLTVALESAKGIAVKPQTSKEAFANFIDVKLKIEDI